MTDNKKIISVEEWTRDYGMKLARQVMLSIIDHRDKVGSENYRQMVMYFLAGFISSTINVCMREQPAENRIYSQSEMLKFSEDNFIDLKSRLQDAVSSGVQAGVLSWSGENIEYYAQIKPVPQTVNKYPC